MGPGADPAPRRWGSMRTMSSAPLMFGDGGDVEVSRAGVHNPDRVSLGELSGCGHSTGGSGAAIAAPGAAMT